MKPICRALLATSVLLTPDALWAEVKVVVNSHPSGNDFKFKEVATPRRGDASATASFSLVDGEADANSGALDVLKDGKVPSDGDQPKENFFFKAGSQGGRVAVDLGKVINIKEVNTYSWHGGSRGPQVYKLYGSDGKEAGFKAAPKGSEDPSKSGWKLLGTVDTRPKNKQEEGGQYGVSVTDTKGLLGAYRHLLFDVSSTSEKDTFSNTFFSEIDVIDRDAPVVPETPLADKISETYKIPNSPYEFTIILNNAEDLKDWSKKELVPVVQKWYPIIVDLMPSEGFVAPKDFSITFTSSKNMSLSVPAYAQGNRITCNLEWQRSNLKGEAIGSIVHEMVHVVQQYWGRSRSGKPRNLPGWLTEGIPDYIRWFLYEPQTRGAELNTRSLTRAKYNDSYRVSANFLNWVTEKHNKKIVTKVSAALRDGTYTDDLWKTETGKNLDELNDQWKTDLAARLGAKITPAAPSVQNQLSEAEKAMGWKLLFDGKTLNGWSNFRGQGIRPGWQVKDGTLVCVDPHNAGDIVTGETFQWFELQLDYNISEGGNSGIMFRVTNEGGAAWATGPEFQLEDNAKAADPQRCGWLYGLYQPENDPKTGRPLDATKPAGEWNHISLLISPDKCSHSINGVKYFEYVLGSEEFNQRVAKTKFSKMPLFAKSDKGFIALQGDHGQISFRNVKVRPITPQK